MRSFFKLAMPSGWDFYTGKTINYRENIGKTVTVPNYNSKVKPQLCSPTVIHASLDANKAFIGAKIPCSVYEVQGKPVVSDSEKSGFRRLQIIREIPDAELDEFFGWKYHEACNPVNPLKIQAPTVGNAQIALLQNWASVRDSVWASVGDSVWDSVWASVGDSVWDSVWASVGASVRDSVWASVGASVRDSVWAYIGSLFPNIKHWKYTPTNLQGYPYQTCIDLWRQGYIPSFDGKTWRLHTNLDARIAYEISREKLGEA